MTARLDILAWTSRLTLAADAGDKILLASIMREFIDDEESTVNVLISLAASCAAAMGTLDSAGWRATVAAHLAAMLDQSARESRL